MVKGGRGFVGGPNGDKNLQCKKIKKSVNLNTCYPSNVSVLSLLTFWHDNTV